MLKAAQKKKLSKIITSVSTLPGGCQQHTRSISTHWQYDEGYSSWTKRRNIFDTNILQNHNVGMLRLNREHRYNMLSSNHIKNVKRGIDTLNIDDEVHFIYMTTEKGEHFCNGTDFRQIMHYKKEKNWDKLTEYLTDLYELQTLVAKLNKPMMVVAPGHAFNSGATLFSASALPITTLSSKMRFNEACFGFVPHAGASFLLSRLPNEVGTFLALTGLPLVGGDVMEYKLADLMLHDNIEVEKDLYSILLSMERPYPNSIFKTENYKQTQWGKYLALKNQERREAMISDQLERSKRQNDNGLGETFMEPKDRRPEIGGEADFKHKKLLQRYNEIHHPKQEIGYFDFDQLHHTNYFDHIMGYVKGHIGNPHKQYEPTFMRHEQAIHRCFYSHTVEEIIQNLKRENTPFARQCLDAMERNSMLSMKLALKMLRNALNTDYKGAMEMEITVALNKIQHEDFELGVSEVLMKPGNHGTSPAFEKNVSDQLVNSFFERNPLSKDVKLDIVENALLPTRFYYKEYSDHARLWLNEESTTQPWVRDTFDQDVQEALREHGIDIRDRALTQKSARKQLKDIESLGRKEQLFVDRMKQLMNDDKLRNNYFDQVQAQLDTLDKSSSAFYKLVNEQIYKVFERGFLKKLQTIYEKSKEAQGLDKRRMFIRLKKFLFKSRIFTILNEDIERQLKQIINMPPRELHLKEKWDQSYRDVPHPDLERSFLWQLSKAVGKVNIAPIEIAKSYLTGQNSRQNMTLYTFDKEELIKLRRDILENPEKYEKLLVKGGIIRGGSGIFEAQSRHIEQEVKEQEYEYWYRALNDGVSPLDSLPGYRNYIYYKEYVRNVEKNTVETLKLTVTRLINDFETSENGTNNVTEFEQLKGQESKRQAFTRLAAMLSQPDKQHTEANLLIDSSLTSQIQGLKITDPAQNIETSIKNTGSSTARTGPTITQPESQLNDIKKQILNYIEEDAQMKQLFQSHENATSNSLVFKFREELISQFTALIELVLLNKFQGVVDLPKQLIQNRYDTLASVKMTQDTGSLTQEQQEQQQISSLRIIDAYLNHANNTSLIRETVDIVKPYFLKMIESKVDDEQMRVLKGIKQEITGSEILFYYMVNINYPEIRSHPVLKRMNNFNENRDHFEFSAKIEPLSNPFYYMRQYFGQMGHSRAELVASSLAEKEQILDQTVAAEYQEKREMEKIIESRNEMWNRETEEARIRHLQTPYDQLNPDAEVDKVPAFNFNAYTLNEVKSIMELNDKVHALQVHIEENIDLLQQQLELSDWMLMFAKSVKDYGMDMQVHFRHVVPSEKYLKTDYLREMQNIFNGNRHLDWKDLATYADFLRGFGDALHESTRLQLVRDKRTQNYASTEFFMKNIRVSPQDVQLQLSQDFAFKVLTGGNNRYELDEEVKSKQRRRKYGISTVISRQDKLRQEYIDFQKMQENINKSVQIRDSIKNQAERAPTEVKELVQMIFEDKPHYYDLEKLEKLLLKKSYNQIKASNLIDRDQIMQDVRSGSLLQDFVKNYSETRVDVLTLAETKAAVDETIADQSNKGLHSNRGIIQQIKTVIDFVNRELASVPNSRRKEITIGQFLQKFANLESVKLQNVATDMLKKQLEEALGNKTSVVINSEGALADGEAATINWAFAGQTTEPFTHKLINQNSSEQDPSALSSQNRGRRGASSEQLETNSIEQRIDDAINYRVPKASDQGDKTVLSVNPLSGVLEATTERQFEMNEVLRDAQESLELKPEFEAVRAYYENKVLEAYSAPDYNETVIVDLVKTYLELRLKECMLTEGFKQKTLGHNGHIYLQLLKEKVFSELGVDSPAEKDDLKYESMIRESDNILNPNRIESFLEGKYNTAGVNNLDALGYDNFEQRLENQISQVGYDIQEKEHAAKFEQAREKNRQLAHENFFDKLLADFFLQKRGQYAKTNELIVELDNQFGQKSILYSEGHPRKNSDPNNIDPRLLQTPKANMSFALLHQNIEKSNGPSINPINSASMMELDQITAQALQRGMNGLSEAIRNPDLGKNVQIPVYFDMFDVRRPPQQYVQDKMEQVLEQLFDARRKVEVNMSRRELLAYDKMLTQYLVKDQLFPKLVAEIEIDKNQLWQLQQMGDKTNEQKEDDFVSILKNHNDQQRQNNQVKNEDALYKWLTYTGMLEKDMRENERDTLRSGDIPLSLHSFDRFYKQELLDDAKREPRPINPDDYKPKTQLEKMMNGKQVFKTLKEKENDYFKEFETYKQNKKETQDRNKMFYVLEQFFAAAKSKPAPSDPAQQAIMEYFNDTENTYFFDKNKIR